MTGEWTTSSTSATPNYMYIYTSDSTSSTTTYYPYVWRVSVPGWTEVEPPMPGGIVKAEHFHEMERRLRKEFDEKLQQMMQQMLKIVMLLPRNGHQMEYRKGVWCGNCGNFIPEEKMHDRCEYCGK